MMWYQWCVVLCVSVSLQAGRNPFAPLPLHAGQLCQTPVQGKVVRATLSYKGATCALVQEGYATKLVHIDEQPEHNNLCVNE